MPLMPSSLEDKMQLPDELTPRNVQTWVKEMLEGLVYCHKRWVLHRDLKPANLLFDENMQVKLGDFGLSRVYGTPDRLLTNNVVTQWYKSPELLYGSVEYGAGVDMWSVGCIFAEMLLKRPGGLFPGRIGSDVDQLGRIFMIMGTPNVSKNLVPKPGNGAPISTAGTDWPDVDALPYFVQFKEHGGEPLKSVLKGVPEIALDLLQQFLVLNPSQRVSAEKALQHKYFTEAL